MDNDYNRIAKVEQEKIQARNILVILQGIKDLNTKLDEMKKEIRVVREDMRNIDKLRPLRSKEEKPEKPIDGQIEIPAK